jgi:dynein heavy chain 2
MREQYECKTLFEFFVSRVRKNLNVVVSLDNKHPKFTANCASNPALFTKSIILWNEGLSKESLQAVARAELEQSMAHLGKSADQIIGGAVYLHNQSTQDFGVSPQHFINFI